MNNQYLAEVINKLLVGLSQSDIQQVLTKVEHDQKCLGYVPNNLKTEMSVNVHRRGRLCKISKDPEVQAFIHSLPYLEQTDILAEVVAKFGVDRAPSRSGLCRYFMKWRKAE